MTDGLPEIIEKRLEAYPESVQRILRDALLRKKVFGRIIGDAELKREVRKICGDRHHEG